MNIPDPCNLIDFGIKFAERGHVLKDLQGEIAELEHKNRRLEEQHQLLRNDLEAAKAAHTHTACENMNLVKERDEAVAKLEIEKGTSIGLRAGFNVEVGRHERTQQLLKEAEAQRDEAVAKLASEQEAHEATKAKLAELKRAMREWIAAPGKPVPFRQIVILAGATVDADGQVTWPDEGKAQP